MIKEIDIIEAQEKWADGIISIGKIYINGGDYKTAAVNFINELYNYDEGMVLFKPTLASIIQFRTDFEGALSYFIGGNEKYPEDKGFALKPWKNIRWDNIGIKIIDNVGLAMGNYYLTTNDGGEVIKVEYSLAFKKCKDNKLKIILHGSHFPYKPLELFDYLK